MISNRSHGLCLLSQSLIILYMLSLFGLMFAVGVYVFDRINHEFINIPLYFGGVLVAGLLSHQTQHEHDLTALPSFRWVAAMRQTNWQVLLLALVLFAIVFSTKDKAMSRLFLGSFLLIFWISAIPLNRFFPEWISSLVFRRNDTIRTVFLGSAKSAQGLEDWARRQPFLGIEILGLVTYEMSGKGSLQMPVMGDFMDLEQIIKERRVDQVVLLETRNSDWWVDSVVEMCDKAGCRILIFNPWEEYFEKELRPLQQGGHTFFSLQEEPLENPINRGVKRVVDICIALPVVLFVLPWLFLLVKFFQRNQSPGPTLCIQQRSGQKGRLFKIYKFRSMYWQDSGAGDESKQAGKDDARIFEFGQFMRKTSIDEFPQFLNVLKGDMSVIGPRPHLIQHDDDFSEQVNIYRTRHFVKPGITGLAQCKGFRGEVTEKALIEERVRYDLQYIRGWSFWLDIWILVKTFVQIFFPPKSAY